MHHGQKGANRRGQQYWFNGGWHEQYWFNGGLVGHNIKAFNGLIDEGIPQILTDLFHINNVIKDDRDQTELDRMHKSIKIEIQFYDVNVGSPTYATYPVGKIVHLYPNVAWLLGCTYTAPLSLAMEVMLTAYYTDGWEEERQVNIPAFQVLPHLEFNMWGLQSLTSRFQWSRWVFRGQRWWMGDSMAPERHTHKRLCTHTGQWARPLIQRARAMKSWNMVIMFVQVICIPWISP